jgi:glutamyl-tRNA reductase
MGLAEREQWALLPDSWPIHLARAKESPLQEAVIVSTCNRTELYAVAEDREHVEWYFSRLYPQAPLSQNLYWHESDAAVRHLMRVSSGLDSMCLGEPQILGQIKQAYQVACDIGTVGAHFRALFPAAFSVSKQVRTQTNLGVGAVTLAYAVCQLVRQLYKGAKKRRVLCVGAGETIESMLAHLCGQPGLDVAIINRSTENAVALAKKHDVTVCRWDNLPLVLQDADIVITATGSDQPIITQAQIEQVCAKRMSTDPLFFADLAVPRDIEPGVANLPGVFLYNLDDMQQVLERNQSHRTAAAEQAHAIVNEEAVRFAERSKLAASADIIKAFRDGATQLRDQCLERALSQLQAGSDAEFVIRRLANDLTNKLLHEPTVQLRQSITRRDEQSES